jgi:putative thioredoxin
MDTPTQTQSPLQAADTSAVIEVTTQSFMADVIEASQSQLVLLDLWAPWCGPCKQLTPVLETLAENADGQIRLAKMNIDDHPEVAQQLKVQSIPAVFAFKDGQPVDGFMGALPESDIKKFIEKNLDGELGPSPAEALLETAADSRAAGQLDDAMECYAAALEQDPENVKAMAGLAQAHLASSAEAAEKIAAAQAALSGAGAQDNDPDLGAARAALALEIKMADKPREAGAEDAIAPLLAAVAQNEKNHQARFDLALAYHGAGQRELALEALLDSIALDRAWNEEAARKQLVELFDAYGATDALVVAARRRLSSILFS